MKEEISKEVVITSRGQLTLPARVRRAWKLSGQRKVRLDMTEEGVVTLRPLPPVMSFFGALKGKVPYNASEKDVARRAMGKRGK